MVNPLEQLPVKRLWARDLKTKQDVLVLVDGDYDGEYFSEFEWLVNPLNRYVYSTTWYKGAKEYRFQYLHHLVLPPKKGYWRTFKNGNRLDCRSSNIVYKTPAQNAQERSDRERAKTVTDYYKKMKQLGEAQ